MKRYALNVHPFFGIGESEMKMCNSGSLVENETLYFVILKPEVWLFY